MMKPENSGNRGHMEAKNDSLARSRRIYLAENAIGSLIFSMVTGSFFAGLLSWMGASPATCALVGAFPQLGCMLQMVSPFFFERLKHRKKAIILCCFSFRFLLGCMGVMPLLFGGAAQGAVVTAYLTAFLIAGFVTPGLTQWMMDLAPKEGRGRYFARRDIIASVVSAVTILLLSAALDAMIEAGYAREGYMLVFGVVLVLSIVDAVLLSRMEEPETSGVVKLMPADILRPFRDPRFFPIILFVMLWILAENLSLGFLPVYQLRVLGLDYKMIALMTTISSAAGIAMSWVWGVFADRYGFRRLLIAGCVLMTLSSLGWFCLPVSLAWLAPVLQCISTVGGGAYSMANVNLQYAACPEEGKTAYLGVAAAASNIVGYAAVLLGAQLQPLLAQRLDRLGIPVLFLLSAIAYAVCIICTRSIANDKK